MTTVLTRASTFYMPSECGPGRYNRASKRAPHSKVAQENTTLLLLEKPDAKVRSGSRGCCAEWVRASTGILHNESMGLIVELVYSKTTTCTLELAE